MYPATSRGSYAEVEHGAMSPTNVSNGVPCVSNRAITTENRVSEDVGDRK